MAAHSAAMQRMYTAPSPQLRPAAAAATPSVRVPVSTAAQATAGTAGQTEVPDGCTQCCNAAHVHRRPLSELCTAAAGTACGCCVPCGALAGSQQLLQADGCVQGRQQHQHQDSTCNVHSPLLASRPCRNTVATQHHSTDLTVITDLRSDSVVAEAGSRG
jgi:hypothetical protein